VRKGNWWSTTTSFLNREVVAGWSGAARRRRA
jgi:hypothetical protein